MKIGFGRMDITPRVGVPLCGFAPFWNRYSIGVRDRLWARAMAVEQDGRRVVIVSCDIIGIVAQDVQRVRDRLAQLPGANVEMVMISCSHTHSGPDTWLNLIGRGGYDPPYMELLPGRIAAAALKAIEDLEDAQIGHAQGPCEHIAVNREYDQNAPPLAEALADNWRPAKPELTDTTCHVLSVHARGRLKGFVSYFGCHPVTCCQQTHYIHGDFTGVATNLLEQELGGAVGLFLQGAEGDINSCVVHKPEPESLKALDIIAARYAKAVRRALTQTSPLDDQTVRSAQRKVTFTRANWTPAQVQAMMTDIQASLPAQADDDSREYRWAILRLVAFRRLLEAMNRGQEMNPPVELLGIRIGPISLLASPYETFQSIKNHVCGQTKSSIPLVLSLVNGIEGYAVDARAVGGKGYAANVGVTLTGELPFTMLHEELAPELLKIDALLQ